MTQVRDGRRRRAATATAALAVASVGGLVAGATPAAAAGPVDQQQTVIDFPVAVPGNGVAVGQTFTSAVAGILDQVDVAFERGSASTTGSFTVEVQTVAGGQPTGTVLTSGTIPAAAVAVSENGADTDMAFYGAVLAPVQISAGQDFAIVVSHPTDEWFTSLAFGDRYAPGLLQVRDPLGNWQVITVDADVAFRTHVSGLGLPPEVDGILSGLLRALGDAIPALRSLTDPLRSLLHDFNL